MRWPIAATTRAAASTLLLMALLCCAARPAAAASCHQTLSQAQFPSCTLLDDSYALHWSVGNDSVTFGIEIDQTTGWFALGLSEGGGMRGADMWVFQKQADNSWKLGDYWSKDYVQPKEDNLQDAQLVSVQQSASGTVAVFTRAFNTCDVEQDQIIYTNFQQPYIHAYGSDTFGYHGAENRGTKFIVLNATKPVAAVSNAGTADEPTKQLALLFDNYTIPANETTTYTCINFAAPVDQTYHLIATNYSITPNKKVHHMLLQVCSQVPTHPLGKPYACPNIPPECSELWLVWVPGQEPEQMEPNTGFRFGKNAIKYFMVQIHYTNVEQDAGVQDSSGFVIEYTPKLRKYDLGVLWLGTEGFEIAPGQELAGIPPSVCPAECTSRFTSDLNLVHSEFHMHKLGAKQTAQHLIPTADGFQEIAPLNYRDHYDFDWQGGTFILPGGETLKRGSALITTCWWNTKNQKNITRFGLSSYDEMCYNFLRYWPAQKIDRCMTLLGSEQNGTALASCANQGELFMYLAKKNMTQGFSQELVMDLIQQGFVVPFNTSQYKDYKPYERTSAQCAAQLEARASTSNATSSGGANSSTAGQPAAALQPPRSAAAPAAGVSVLATGLLGALVSVLALH